MTKYYLVRHGEPKWSLKDKYHLKESIVDHIPLTQSGIRAATLLANDERIKNSQIIITSPYTRALHTAAILSRITGMELRVELQLREWQPDTLFSIKDEDEDEENDNKGIGKKKIWLETKSLKGRILEVLDKYSQYSEVTVVTHEMIINTLVRSRDIDYCSITEFEI